MHICVWENNGQFLHAKSGISPQAELAWSLVQDLPSTQNTDLHITKALDKKKIITHSRVYLGYFYTKVKLKYQCKN